MHEKDQENELIKSLCSKVLEYNRDEILDEMKMETEITAGSEPASDDQSGPASQGGHPASHFTAVA